MSRHKLLRRADKTVASLLYPEEYNALRELAHKHNCSVSQYLRGIIVDAIVEDGFDARRFRSPRNTQGREGPEAPRATGQ